MGMQLIETVTVGSGGASSIEFTSIPQDGVDLLLVNSLRCSTADRTHFLQVNNDTTNYTALLLRGDGSSVATFDSSPQLYQYSTQSTDTANTFASNQAYISNYAGSTSKSISIETVQENNATASFAGIQAGAYTQTTAITSVKLQTSAGLYVENSTASLYKITAD